MFRTLLFDLDGTLTDPGIGITNSVAYALDKLGFAVPPREELYSFIGPPLRDSFMSFCGYTDEADGDRAVEIYREYFRPKGIFENKVYAGVPEMLSRLKEANLRLYVATSKPEPFALQVLEHFALLPNFDGCVGSDMAGTLVKKADVIGEVFRRYGLSREGALMVGDRSFDVKGGHLAGLPVLGVSYGYGSKEELEIAGADAIAASPAEATEYILNN